MAERRQFTIADRYAFYQAYEGLCSYCRRPLEFNDFEIDHVIAWHLAADPQEWAETLGKHGLPANFDVDGDENLRPACRPCNGSKSGALPPRDHVLMLLEVPRKKAAHVAALRTEVVSELRFSKALAIVSMAAAATPSIRDQVLGVLAIEHQPALIPQTAWPDDLASQRVRKLLGAASSDLLTWPQDTNGRWIDRPELSELETAIDGSGAKAIALVGPAGSGKSALLARLGAGLTARGYVLLAIKADMLPRNVCSIDDLDKKWGFVETLPVVLERLVAESPVAVLIDQLDALASLMDAHSERLSAMLSLISRLSLTPQIVVIVSCRSFDADHDMRLKNLIGPAKTIRLHDLPWESVEGLLSAHGYRPASWPKPVRELLSRAQHLKTFLQYFQPGSGQLAFTSLQAMLECIIQERVIDTFGSGAASALDAIALEMSASEELWVPVAPLLQHFAVEIQQLKQAGLIIADHGGFRIGFAHQTFFEFLRGRLFVSGNESLFDAVVAQQGGLAIRPVLWSAISYLRNADPAHYRHQFRALLESPGVRLHIKLLVVDFLGTVGQPMIEEAAPLKGLLKDAQIRPHVMRAIEKKSEWFEFLRDAVAQCKEDGTAAGWQASWVLGPALVFDRAFVLSTLEASWLIEPQLDIGTFNVFRECSEWDERAERIAETVVSRTAIAPTYVCHLAELMTKNRPDLAAKLVRAKLDFDLGNAMSALTAPVPPAGSDASTAEQIRHSLRTDVRLRPIADLVRPHGEWHGLDVFAKRGSAELIEALWGWVEQVALLLSEPTVPGARRYRPDDGWRFGAGTHSSSYLAQAIWATTAAFAMTDGLRFLKWASVAGKSEALAVHQLIVHGLIAIAKDCPSIIVSYLTGDHRRLSVGEGPYRDARDLLRAVKDQLSPEQMLETEAWIESWNPFDLAAVTEERRAVYEHRNAQARLDLLSALREQPKPDSQDQNTPVVSPEIEDHGGYMVGSPKDAQTMEFLSDVELLSFLAEWPDQRVQNTDYRLGGSHEVAAQFGEFCRRQPQRALSLISRLQPGEQELAAGAGLDSLASADGQNPEPVSNLLHELLKTFRSELFRDRAVWAFVQLSQRGGGLQVRSILDLENLIEVPKTEQLAPNNNPHFVSDDKVLKEESILWGHRGGGLPNGNYPVLLALTLGLLRRDPPDREAWLEILERHLEKPERPAVWQALLDQLRYLGGCERVRSSAFVQHLFERYPALLTTVDGVRFVAANHLWLPSSFFHESIARIEGSTWPLRERAAGELWMLRAGLVPNDTIAQKRLASALEQLRPGKWSQFLLGFVTSAAETWMSARLREASTAVLVAAAAGARGAEAEILASAFLQRGAEYLPGDSCTDQVLSAFARSPDLLATQYTHAIADRMKELLEKGYSAVEVGQFCKRLVEVAGTAIADMGTALYLASNELVDISITLQRFPEAKADGTWIFEKLLAMNAYRVAETVADLDHRVG